MNISLSYKAQAQELANATVYFFHNKLVMLIIKKLISICALLTICKISIILYNTHAIPYKDLFFASIMLLWIYYHQHLHYWTLLIGIKSWLKKVDTINYYLHKDYLELQMKTYKITQYWKHIKKIYAHEDGYIVPFTGFKNSGKFAWLPRYAFTQKHEQEFLEALQNKHIKITTYKKL